MADLSRLTKAEILELLEEKDKEVKVLQAKEDARKKQIEIDLAFGSELTPERKEQLKNQKRKDFIKRMTHGRWCSEEKLQEFMDAQNGINKVRPIG